LGLDPDCIGLHMAQSPRLLDQMRLDRLSVATCPRYPACHGPRIEAEGDDDRL